MKTDSWEKVQQIFLVTETMWPLLPLFTASVHSAIVFICQASPL